MNLRTLIWLTRLRVKQEVKQTFFFTFISSFGLEFIIIISIYRKLISYTH